MADVLKDYLDIISKYSQNNSISKRDRKNRHNEMSKWLKNEYCAPVEVAELNRFLNKNPNLVIVRQFVIKVVVPCVKNDMENGCIEGITLLFEKGHSGVFPHRRIYPDDWVHIFCKETNGIHSSKELVDMILAKDPQNCSALEYLYCLYKGIVEYSLHELPWGIVTECETVSEMLEILEELPNICEKLGLDEKEYIAHCKRIYLGYEDYIQNKDHYSEFEEYLIKNIPNWDMNLSLKRGQGNGN